MAHVGRELTDHTAVPGTTRRDRGQLILVTALGLAMLFVTLALILNTAIYTENLASRSGDIGGSTDAVRYQDAARSGVGGVIEYSNAHNNSSHSTLQSNVSAGVDRFENFSARLFAAGDRAVETNLQSTVNGTRIAQTNASRNFTNTSGEPDWTLAEDVTNTRSVEINVSDISSLESAGSGSAFELEFEDTSGKIWRLNVTRDGSTTIGIRNGDASEFTCTASTATPTINVTAGTINGEECEGLEMTEGIDTPYTISIDNGDNINGTYSMIVDNATLAGSPGPHFVEDGSGQPFVAHAMYSANLSIVYETPRLFYNSTVRVAPGESDG